MLLRHRCDNIFLLILGICPQAAGLKISSSGIVRAGPVRDLRPSELILLLVSRGLQGIGFHCHSQGGEKWHFPFSALPAPPSYVKNPRVEAFTSSLVRCGDSDALIMLF